jgi:hypothetical protein
MRKSKENNTRKLHSCHNPAKFQLQHSFKNIGRIRYKDPVSTDLTYKSTNVLGFILVWLVAYHTSLRANLQERGSKSQWGPHPLELVVCLDGQMLTATPYQPADLLHDT